MASEFKRTLVTAALPYANGPIHLGHLAGCYLPSDIYVRFKRLKGEEVAFVCGSDEHGMAITMKARKEGVSPREIVDRYHFMMRDALADFGIAFDHYSRTSSEAHHKVASDFFKTLYDKGVFEARQTDQYYDPEAEQFLADRYITGTCPRCSHDAAYGDQCEQCGATLNPTDLINPQSTLSGATPVLKATTNWFLPLDKFSDDLRSYITSHPEWKPNVYGQTLSWLDAGDGLQPRSMTRDLDWGVPVPVQGAEGKVLYVWFDAPLGYITATQELKGADWETWWKDPSTRLVHFIGKDNIVFHAVIFPILLKDHGDLILPDNVPASEFLNLEGDKLSTSRNWAVWLHEYLQSYPDKADELKYVLTSIAPETKDSEFTWKEYQTRINSELADILGNFVNRALVLSQKYYEGVVPALGEMTVEDQSVLNELAAIPQRISKLVYAYKFREAQAEAMNMARLGNKYLADQEPWKVVKTDPERVKTIMHIALQITANLSIVLQPFLPETARKLSNFMNVHTSDWNDAGRPDIVQAGTQTREPSILFPKIEDDTVTAEVEKLKSTVMTKTTATPQKEEVTFDDFSKMDIRLGTILEAEKVEKADKLLKLLVDTGLDKRTIVSGIAAHYAPEDVIGKTVSVLLNLAPRKIRGIESQGMILMAEDAEGNLSFMVPEKGFNAGGGIC